MQILREYDAEREPDGPDGWPASTSTPTDTSPTDDLEPDDVSPMTSSPMT